MPASDVKQLIIESATKYFSKYGFHKTTMDEIARNIHKAKGVLYYYFSSKEELFRQVLKQELDKVKAELGRIVNTQSDAISILRDYTFTRLKLLSTAVNYHETLKADFFEKYSFVKDVRDDFEAFEYNLITQVLTNGKKEGLLDSKDLEKEVNIYMIIMYSLEIPFFLQNKFAEYESTLNDIATMIFSSFRYQQMQNKIS